MVVERFDFGEELFHGGGFLVVLFNFFMFIFGGFGIFGFFIEVIHMCSSFFDLGVGEFNRVLQTLVNYFGEGVMVFEIFFDRFFFEMGTK